MGNTNLKHFVKGPRGCTLVLWNSCGTSRTKRGHEHLTGWVRADVTLTSLRRVRVSNHDCSGRRL